MILICMMGIILKQHCLWQDWNSDLKKNLIEIWFSCDACPRSLRGDCRDAALDPLYWISYKSGRCTTITSVNPHELQRTTARTLQLVIDNLPNLPGNYICAFSAVGKVTPTPTLVATFLPPSLSPASIPSSHRPWWPMPQEPAQGSHAPLQGISLPHFPPLLSLFFKYI